MEAATAREVAGETGLMRGERSQFRVVLHPERDPRGHRVSVVFTASLTSARGEPRGGGDARQARQFSWDALPELAFDPVRILEDYRNSRA